MSGKILRDFVSDIDKLIEDFDKKNPKLSKSQQKEIQKYDRIYFLRDNEDRPNSAKDIFELLL